MPLPSHLSVRFSLQLCAMTPYAFYLPPSVRHLFTFFLFAGCGCIAVVLKIMVYLSIDSLPPDVMLLSYLLLSLTFFLSCFSSQFLSLSCHRFASKQPLNLEDQPILFADIGCRKFLVEVIKSEGGYPAERIASRTCGSAHAARSGRRIGG